MIRSCFLIKLVKNFYNYLLSFKLDNKLKTTSFEIGKQTTFVCSRCGTPFPSQQWEDVNLEYKSPLTSQHLISNYFKLLKHKKFYRGAVLRPQIQYFEKISHQDGSLMTCWGCSTSNFQNIIVLKVMNINVALLL